MLLTRIKFLEDMPLLLQRIYSYIESVRREYVTYNLNLSHTIWIGCLQYILVTHYEAITGYDVKEKTWLHEKYELQIRLLEKEEVLKEVVEQQGRLIVELTDCQSQRNVLQQRLQPVLPHNNNSNNNNNNEKEIRETNVLAGTASTLATTATATTTTSTTIISPASDSSSIPLLLPSNRRKDNIFTNIKLFVRKVFRSILKIVSFGKL
jgi:hypothetical protein